MKLTASISFISAWHSGHFPSWLAREFLGVEPTHSADNLPLLIPHRLHRQTRRGNERHVGQLRCSLHIAQFHGLRHISDRPYVDTLPSPGRVSGIRVSGRDHLHNADDLLTLARVVEETEVTHSHRSHVVAGEIVAHTIPRLTLLTTGFEHFPGEGIWLRFE